jgi:hypothetical protein
LAARRLAPAIQLGQMGVEAWCDLVLKWKPIGWAEEMGQIKSGVGPFLGSRERGHERLIAPRERSRRTRRGSRPRELSRSAATPRNTASMCPIEHKQWPDCRRELLTFPAGVHDDFVDACALVFQLLDRMTNGRPLPKDEPDDHARCL